MQLNIIEIGYIENYDQQIKNAAAWFFGSHKTRSVAILVCPFCEVAAEIDGETSNHKIADDGSVNPSVYCDCGKFHAYIKLAGYAEQLAKRKQQDDSKSDIVGIHASK